MTATPLDRAEPLTRADLALEDTWDLSTILPDEAAWEAELERAAALLETAAAHRGRLGDGPAALRAAIDDILAARLSLERVMVHATLRHHEDMADGERLERYERAIGLSVRAAEELAFFDPELLALLPD